MAQNNITVQIHYNGSIFPDVNVGVIFQNTNVQQINIHPGSNYMRLKERLENKLQQQITDIYYRYPCFNDGVSSVTYTTTKIEDDNDLGLMFQCHSMYNLSNVIELYVCLVDNDEGDQLTYPTQTSQSHQYQMSQETIMSLTPVPETILSLTPVPDEDVGDDNDYEEARYVETQNLFSGESDNSDNDIPVVHQDQVQDLYNPPLHMRNPTYSLHEDASIFETTEPLRIEGGLLGMEFNIKEGCVFAIRQFHIRNCLDYSVYKSNSKRLIIKCVNEECTFKCRAYVGKGNGKWVITKVSGPHTCMSSTMSQDHRKLDSNLIFNNIKSLINSDASLKVKHIIAHIRETFNYTISYKKAWISKNKVIAAIYGNWETSYNDLPQWLLVMKTFLPGTIIELETLPIFSNEGTQISGARVFHRLFWAFQPCIKGFAFCKPVVQVDGTWLYGKYMGTLLMAVAQDENKNIFPIAFALVEGETEEAWSFFLRNLRMHVTPQPNLCLISDRHQSIKSAYNNPDNGWQHPPSSHVYCIRHIAQNFMREFKDKELRKKNINMGIFQKISLLPYLKLTSTY